VRVVRADGRSHVVNRTSVIIAEKWAWIASSFVCVVLTISFQIGIDELVILHTEMPGDAFNIFLTQLDHHRFAAVRAASAINDLKHLLVEFAGQLVGIESIITALHATEKFVVLLVVTFGVSSPARDNGVVRRDFSADIHNLDSLMFSNT
jgi:hypothetical protein